MQDVMVDLETLGVSAGCAILSIGAVAFDPRTGEVEELGFYTAVDHLDCLDRGLFKDVETVAWWDRQGTEARAVFEDPDKKELPEALEAFNQYLSQFTGVRVWGNGADFDNAIMAALYRKAGIQPGWKPYNGRCYRTVKNLAPHIKLVREGVYHNALADAMSQAKHLCEIVRQTTLTLG